MGTRYESASRSLVNSLVLQTVIDSRSQLLYKADFISFHVEQKQLETTI